MAMKYSDYTDEVEDFRERKLEKVLDWLRARTNIVGVLAALASFPFIVKYFPVDFMIMTLLIICEVRYVLLLVALIFGCVPTLFGFFVAHASRRVLSWWIHRLACLMGDPVANARAARGVIQSIPFVFNRPARHHSHPNSAALRDASALFMDMVAARLGVSTWFCQMSHADERRGRAGCRSYYWCKDLDVAPRTYNPKQSDIVCLVDVDMYMDIPDLIAKDPRMYLISTFQPTLVSAATSEYSFTFNKDNEATYVVAGGADYHHKVWNYGGDVLLATSKAYFGLRTDVTTYNVERRTLDDHHQVIALIPIVHLKSWFWCPAKWLTGDKLARMSIVKQCPKLNINFLRMDVVTTSGRRRSTGVCGEYASASIPVVQDDCLARMAAMYKTDLTAAHVKQVVGDEVTIEAMTSLVRYHRAMYDSTVERVYTAPSKVLEYQYGSLDVYDSEAPPAQEAFMAPFLAEAHVPSRTKANEQRGVDARILSVRVKPEEVVLTPFLNRCVEEFLQQLIPDDQRHTLYPVDSDEVALRQNRPSQRRILESVSLSLDSTGPAVVEAFMKAETYGKPTDPRMISIMSGLTKALYAAFVTPFPITL